MRNKKLSLILYNKLNSPHYFEFTRKQMRLFLYSFPLIASISLTIIIFIILYFKDIRQTIVSSQPETINTLIKEKKQLLQEKTKLNEITKQLQAKLINSKSSDSTQSLSMFSKTSGQKDLTKKPIISIDQTKLEKTKGKKLILNFNLVNKEKNNKKIDGYVFVIIRNNNIIEIWPNEKLSSDNIFINFYNGEFFTTRRFRPVTAKFNGQFNGDIHLKIIVFSRTGDIIFKTILKEVINV